MQELEKILEEIDKRIEHVQKAFINNENMPGYLLYKKTMEETKEIIRKHMDDGWIPVEDQLPEDDVDVLVTYTDINNEQYTDIAITTYGYAYLGGNKLDFKEWRSPFEYFRSNYIVIAWRPMPEPYQAERSDNNDGE